jgi:DNA-binding MarR family transcriptional regulator
MRVPSEHVAGQVLDVVPAIMRAIRTEMRRHRSCDVNVPQFRTLAFLDHHPGASLSELAEYIGLTLPSMSKLIDGLVERKLVTRQTHAQDRRRITLALTARGQASLRAANESTEAYLAEKLETLSETERATVVRAMQVLRPLFASERELEREPLGAVQV